MSQTGLIAKPGTDDLGSDEPQGGKRPRLLLVEGDGFTRLVLLLHLRLAGFKVEFTSNGILGLEKLRNCHPDVLLVELKLCGLSGLDLIRAARAEPAFGNRPIYVFTRADRMNRVTGRHLRRLDVKLFDKASITREGLVQIFAVEFLGWKPPGDQPPNGDGASADAATPGEMVPHSMIGEIIAAVRDQFELLAKCTETGAQAALAAELLSRVCSLASCAEAAGLDNLARHAKALENYLDQLRREKKDCWNAALPTIRPAIEVMNRMCLDTTGDRQMLCRFQCVIVDEAPGSNQALKHALLKAGFAPVCFEDPPQARNYLTSNPTDLIIANILLPEGHGLTSADIRQLRLHAQTPVIFGPQWSVSCSRVEALPTSAARLDLEPLLLAELVLQALNQVQGKPTSRKVFPAAKRSTARTPSASSNGGVILTCENGFQPVVGATRSRPASTLEATTVAEESVHEPLSWSTAGPPPVRTIQATPGQPTPARAESQQPEDYRSGDIHIEPELKPESSMTDADHVAEIPVILPSAAPIDGRQTDEYVAEASPAAGLQAEVPQPPRAEQTNEGQPDEAARLAAAEDESGRAIPASQSIPEYSPNKVAPDQDPVAATPAGGAITSDQLQVLTPERTQSEQSNQQNQDQNMYKNRNEVSANRALASDMKFYPSQAPSEESAGTVQAPPQLFADAAPVVGTTDTLAKPSATEQQALARCAELEREVASLRQVFEGLDGNFGPEQKTGAETSKKVRDLEEILKQNAAELEKHKAQQQREEAEWQRQKEAANAASRQSEDARRRAESRCAELEQELAVLRQPQEGLAGNLAQEPKAKTELAERLKKLEAQPSASEVGDQEQQFRQGVAALAQAKAELARERGERQRSDERAAEMNGRMQTLHEDLRRMLQTQREDQARNSALEEQERQTRLALEQRTAELDQQKDEHRLLEEQLHQVKEANAQLRHDLSFFEGANKKFDGAQQQLQTRLEASLGAARDHEARLQQEASERQRLAETLENVQRELQTQTRGREMIERELQTAQAALQGREVKLRQETAERQRLKEALDAFQHNLRDGSARDLELSRLQSALNLEQVERNRQEAQLARTRRSALEAARAARALRTGLRRQIREPVDSLVRSAQSLLELETGDEQRKLAEAVLRDVLLVQTRLREPEPAQSEPAGIPETATTTGA